MAKSKDQAAKLERLKEEFPFKWRVQTISEFGATAVAYIDARDAMNMLDDVVGPEGWMDDYKVVDEKLFAGISICLNDQWVTKWDVGTESNTEKTKGQVSDAFKRACVKWGIGRFLYDLPAQKLKTKKYEKNNKFYPVDDRGEILWSGDDLTNYINQKLGKSEGQISESTRAKNNSNGIKHDKTVENKFFGLVSKLNGDKEVAINRIQKQNKVEDFNELTNNQLNLAITKMERTLGEKNG